jgi:fagellar hook-basal body proteins
MSLSASMWTSVTGLLVHGEKMNVIGNNIANVNTVGFKGSRMDFEDFVNQNVFAAAGPSQVGRGVAIGAIYGNFSQGSFESTTDPTDMAISGNGFFMVKPIGSDTEYYTRAGNFRFDATGYLVDPHGYTLQGWKIQEPNPGLASSTGGTTGSGGSASSLKGTGAPTNVKLESFTCDPKHTNTVQAQLNLSRDGSDASTDAVDPFFALFGKWDSTLEVALGDKAYEHPYTIEVYDEGGSKHKITVYFDRVDSSTLVNGGGAVTGDTRYWEYIVTMEPADDHREFFDGAVPADKKGILMTGTLTFDPNGEFKNMSAFVPTSGANFDNLATWVAAPLSSNGFPMFAPNFSGRDDASTPWDPANIGVQLNANATPYLIELNLGLRNKGNTWDMPPAPATAQDVGNDIANMFGIPIAAIEPQSKRTTSYDGSSGTISQSQDGYTFGYLSTVYVDRDGVLFGKYSNGQTLALYQITLYDFPSNHNLRREGGNLFSETRESGGASSGAANSMGLGAVYGNSIEQSNVDLATEFVQMISTQRGFQANSKTITTVDTMLETVIGMKR